MSEYTIGQVTRLAGVSVRMLHHYDELGLLVPSARSESGYRLYSAADLKRLQQILVYRELEFGLGEIGAMLDAPECDVEEHLRRQHGLLRQRRSRIEVLLQAIEQEMEARTMGISLTPEEQLEVFGTDKLPEYEQEAAQRWGETPAWRESQRRTAAYRKEDWVEIKREADAALADFAAAMTAGQPAAGPAAMDLAEAHRRHISRWFYECGLGLHVRLAEMYLSDPRFRAGYERAAPGLAEYVHDAILANAARARA